MLKSLLALSVFSTLAFTPVALADELTPVEAKAREIYAEVISWSGKDA